MPWYNKLPDLKNDPRYLAPKIEENAAQLATIIPLKPNGTDDTANINNAIATLAQSGGGTVQLKEGLFTYTQLRLKSNVFIKGKGMRSTTLKVKNGTDDHSIILDSDTVQYTGISDLCIDGDKGNNTAPTLIYLYRVESVGDSHVHLRDLEVKNGNGNGIAFGTNQRENRLINVHVHNCKGIGILSGYGSTDNWFVDCTANSNDGGGVSESSTSNRWSNIKTWGNGSSTNRAAGFKITGNNILMTNVEAQENWGHGFYLLNARDIIIASSRADANSFNNNHVANTPSDKLYNGYDIESCSNIEINGIAYDFLNALLNSPTQNIGMRIHGTSSKIRGILYSSYQQKDFENANGLMSNDKVNVIVNGVMNGDVNTLSNVYFKQISDGINRVYMGLNTTDNSFRINLNDDLGNYVANLLAIYTNNNIRLGSPTGRLGFYNKTDGVTQQSTVANATDLTTSIALVNDLKLKLQNLGLLS